MSDYTIRIKRKGDVVNVQVFKSSNSVVPVAPWSRELEHYALPLDTHPREAVYLALPAILRDVEGVKP